MRRLYGFFFWAFTLLFKGVALFHPRARKMVRGQRDSWRMLKEKLRPEKRYLWFHASSIGEFEQGRPVLEAIRARHPEYEILLTFYSPSGEAFRNYDKASLVCYLPFDRLHNAERFLQTVKPVAAFFIKYEFWPNYLLSLKEMNVPTYLISGIFRPGQLFFKPWAVLHRQMLRCFTFFFVQNRDSYDLLARAGLAERAAVTGDTRCDRVIEVAGQAKNLPLIEAFVSAHAEGLVWVAGSTWPTDEELVIPYFNTHPAMKLIIAPRRIDPHRLQEIEARLERPFIRYTQLTEANAGSADCILVDCIGLLSSIYRYADLAYVGGGIGSIGLHNVLEPAVYGKAVVFGNVYDKFEEAKGLLAANGGASIADLQQLTRCLDRWIEEPALMEQAGRNAGDFVYASAGAAGKILDELEKSAWA